MVPGQSLCLAHLGASDRIGYLTTLSPGDDVDHRGTTFSGTLLDELLNALRDPATGRPRLGAALFDGATFAAAGFIGATFSADARFDEATFCAMAWFSDATFSADARFVGSTFSAMVSFNDAAFAGIVDFNGATFSDSAWFGAVTFSAEARFDGATFSAVAGFDGATFSAEALFREVTFSAGAGFEEVTFSATAGFGEATFAGIVDFNGAMFSAGAGFEGVMFSATVDFTDAKFSTNADFSGSMFSAAARLGPLVCWGRLDLSSAVFAVPVTIEAAAISVVCVRTRWEATATLRLRHATVDLSDAVVSQPIAVIAHTAPLAVTPRGNLVETSLPGDAAVRIQSLRGVDAAYVVLTNTDLTQCRFFGAFHLDQLRLEGETVFARTPAGTDVRRGFPLRWTDRLTLAEEHHWRTLRTHRPRLRSGWTRDRQQRDIPTPARIPGPPALASLYRQLRKAFEDGKDEPGAADFYYGEMEMRRLDRRRRRNRAERGLLTGYWALSGYGLRASRALSWLALAMTATVVALMMWGLPTNEPKPRTTGTLPATGQKLDLTTDTADPAVTGPVGSRFTAKRAAKATRIAINSVVFRSSGQNLTTTGESIEMASRFFEPVLLGFAALAIRNRVKR
ncbi:pentapeptide repeat-containing protein [Streptomyces sp. NPDC058280]|uniref:pentapeptide repeat-containing protein n=1 Tax=Streptomyces sp. NPDC058280 TaxID=3346419 RepID=UPI0036E4CA96